MKVLKQIENLLPAVIAYKSTRNGSVVEITGRFSKASYGLFLVETEEAEESSFETATLPEVVYHYETETSNNSAQIDQVLFLMQSERELNEMKEDSIKRGVCFEETVKIAA